MLEHKLSDEEQNQISQTIEMFEAITQTQADDYQSLEILKEAYYKLGRHKDWLRTSRRLAEAYFNAGSFSLAMQEAEAILEKEPNAPEILAMLGEIEARLQSSGEAFGPKHALIASPALNGLTAEISGSSSKAIPQGRATEGALIDLKGAYDPNLQERGDDHLAKFFLMRQLFPEDEIAKALEKTTALNKDLSGEALAASLLDQLCHDDTDKLDNALSQLIDRTKFAFIPLEYYDVDRQISRMLPDHLTLGRLFVPFDLISRTIMVACCNPFDAAGRDAVQRSLDYTVSWYLARPSAIVKNLQDIYRLESRA